MSFSLRYTVLDSIFPDEHFSFDTEETRSEWCTEVMNLKYELEKIGTAHPHRAHYTKRWLKQIYRKSLARMRRFFDKWGHEGVPLDVRWAYNDIATSCGLPSIIFERE